MGRIRDVTPGLTIADLVEMTKKHCGISHVRLAIAKGKDLGEEESIVVL